MKASINPTSLGNDENAGKTESCVEFDKAHVSGSNVTIFDASRAIADPLYNRIHGDADPNFRNVRFVANTTRNGRIGAVYDPAYPVHFANSSVSPVNHATAYLPTCVTEAKYLIDMPLLSAHSMFGVTGTGKNWFGSVCWRTNANYGSWNGGWTPSPLHNFGLRNNPMSSYNCIVDLIGHPQLGGKTLLYLLNWTTQSGTTNRVQVAGTESGSYSNNFIDLSPVVVPRGNYLANTNYLDVGGATNLPAKFYRVRLGP